MITSSSPALELYPYDRKQIIRKIRTLENYLGTISKIRYGTANYVVGSGHRPIPATENEEFNTRVLEEWKKWAENPDLCDRSGKNTVYDMQHLCSSGEMGDGEAFVLPQKTSNGYPQLLMVDPLLVDNPSRNSDKNVRDGVKLDGAGKVLGYYVNSGGNQSNSFQTTSKFFRRNQIFHYVTYKRTEQIRGKSPLHSAARHFHDVIDLIAMEISATKTHQAMGIHVKKRQGSTLSLEEQYDDVDEAVEKALAAETGSDPDTEKRDGVVQVHGAAVIEDPEVEEVNMLTSDRPNVSIKEFIYLILKEASNATLIPFEFYHDMSGLGGVTARYSLADAYVAISDKQRRLTRQVSFPIYRWWLASMIKLGKFDDVEIPEKWWVCDWQYPPKITVDIKHDSKALIELLANGLTSETAIFDATGVSRSEHVSRRVKELKEVLEECKNEGVPWELYYQQLFSQKSKGDKRESEGPPKKPDDNQPTETD